MAAAFAFMLFLLVLSRAEWVFFVPAGIGSVMLLFMLIKNPVNGLELQDEMLILSAWRNPLQVPVHDIAKLEIVEWTDSSDFKVHLKSGEIIEAFSGDIPPTVPFRKALAQVGIPLEVN
jgi:hypothetical protein